MIFITIIFLLEGSATLRKEDLARGAQADISESSSQPISPEKVGSREAGEETTEDSSLAVASAPPIS
jgi:hypothetical protein